VIFPLVSREFEGPTGIDAAAIKAAAISVSSYYGESLRAVEVAERHGEREGQERVTVTFEFEHERRDLSGDMVQILLGRVAGAIAPLGLKCRME